MIVEQRADGLLIADTMAIQSRNGIVVAMVTLVVAAVILSWGASSFLSYLLAIALAGVAAVSFYRDGGRESFYNTNTGYFVTLDRIRLHSRSRMVKRDDVEQLLIYVQGGEGGRCYPALRLKNGRRVMLTMGSKRPELVQDAMQQLQALTELPLGNEIDASWLGRVLRR
jgi:hypothetical protein